MSEPKTPAATEKELRNAFKKFDRDGSGTISSDEFTAIVTRPGGGKPLTVDQALRLFRRADLNGDGVVDYGEFCKSWGAIRSGEGDSGPKLADLKHPDAEHLMLGINFEGLREACELVGFPYRCYKGDHSYGACNSYDAWDWTYKRKDHPEMAWVDEAYPGSGRDCRGRADDHDCYLGYDFCCAIKTWLKANGHENESICQVLLKRGSKNVRRANVFYSHTQGVWLPHTIQRMREGVAAHKAQLPQASKKAKALAAKQRARFAELPALFQAAAEDSDDEETANLEKELKKSNDALFPDESHLFFWLDYTTLKQCKRDFDLKRIRQVIREIGLTLAELDLDPQAYLARSFCILELLATVECGATLLVQMHFLRAYGAALDLAASPVNAKAAQTRDPTDKATIDGFVEAMPGGFEKLNATITEAIKAAAVPIAEQYSGSEIDLDDDSGNQDYLTNHDAAVVVPLILKSNRSVTTVYLSGTMEIGDEEAKAFAEALKVNKTLKELHLAHCGIGVDGTAALAEALRSNTSLTRLDLCGNGIGDDGAAFAGALRSNTTLRSLSLAETGISQQGKQLLLDAWENPTGGVRPGLNEVRQWGVVFSPAYLFL